MDLDIDEIIKAIANPYRRKVLAWLKDPEANFDLRNPAHTAHDGVCVGKIVEKAGLSQSTISAYMDALQRAGLVKSERCGQWTFYRRNEDVIAAFIRAMEVDL